MNRASLLSGSRSERGFRPVRPDREPWLYYHDERGFPEIDNAAGFLKQVDRPAVSSTGRLPDKTKMPA
jgi:hypothetical protein